MQNSKIQAAAAGAGIGSVKQAGTACWVQPAGYSLQGTACRVHQWYSLQGTAGVQPAGYSLEGTTCKVQPVQPAGYSLQAVQACLRTDWLLKILYIYWMLKTLGKLELSLARLFILGLSHLAHCSHILRHCLNH